METKQGYHHGNLRQAVMDVAVTHLRQSGIESLSLRAIARELGVSQTAPYRHFGDKNGLLAALACGGFEHLTEVMADAFQANHQGAEGFQQAGLAYVGFARSRPEVYRLMFGAGIVDRRQYSALNSASDAAFGFLVAMIEQGIQSGWIVSQDVQLLANSAWAMVHGLSTLMIDVLGEGMNEVDIAKQLQLATHVLGLGMRSVGHINQGMDDA